MFDFLLGSDLLSSLVAFALVLIPAVIVHEFGHFLAAKAVGITILEFGIGYPPRLFRLFNWRETEFTLNLLPLGGFVRPLGEDMIRTLSDEQTEKEREALQQRLAERRESVPVETEDERKTLAARGFTNLKTINEARPPARILFMSAGAIANVIAAFVLFVIVGLIGVERIVGERFIVTDITPGSVLAEAGVQYGDVIESVDGTYVFDVQDMLTAIEESSGDQIIFTVLRGDPESETVEILPVAVSRDALAGESLTTLRSRLLVLEIQVDSPADVGGVLPGDQIIGIGGQNLEAFANPFEELRSISEQNAGQPITIDVLREGEVVTLDITPRVNPAQGEGYLGAAVSTQFASDALGATLLNATVFQGDRGEITDTFALPLGEAVRYGATQMRTVFDAILGLPGRLLSGNATPEEGRVISIVGISQIGGSFLQTSIETGSPFQILNFVALVNIALGLTNMLPLPPLDGGRILFIIIEMLRGKPLSQRREEAIMIVGMVFLLALGVVVIVQDIRDPILNLVGR